MLCRLARKYCKSATGRVQEERRAEREGGRVAARSIIKDEAGCFGV